LIINLERARRWPRHDDKQIKVSIVVIVAQAASAPADQAAGRPEASVTSANLLPSDCDGGSSARCNRRQSIQKPVCIVITPGPVMAAAPRGDAAKQVRIGPTERSVSHVR
jgi:hypothetical protein